MATLTHEDGTGTGPADTKKKKSPSYLGLTNHSSVALNIPLFTGRVGIVNPPHEVGDA